MSKTTIHHTAAGPFGPRVKKSNATSPSEPIQQPLQVRVVAPQPFASPAHPKQQQSRVLHRQVVRHPHKQAAPAEQHIQYEQFIEPAQQTGKLRSALQSCFGLFA